MGGVLESPSPERPRWPLDPLRLLPYLAALLVVSLSAPSLFNGWASDDYWQQAFIVGQLEGASAARWWDLFNTMGRVGERDVPAWIQLGLLPWWTAPDFSLAALRPVSALTHYADYLLWPGSALCMHAHSLAWLAQRVDSLLPVKIWIELFAEQQRHSEPACLGAQAWTGASAARPASSGRLPRVNCRGPS